MLVFDKTNRNCFSIQKKNIELFGFILEKSAHESELVREQRNPTSATVIEKTPKSDPFLYRWSKKKIHHQNTLI